MSHPRWKLVSLACLAAVSAAGAAVAVLKLEQASAEVNRLAPAITPFSAATLNRLGVPAGFTVSVFARGLKRPRMMDVAADGTVFVTEPTQDRVLALRDTDGDGVADQARTFVSGLAGVHGVAVRDEWLYLASSTTLWRVPLATAVPEAIVTGLPDGGQHPNRMVRVGPEGNLYVSVGSSCNDCAEDNLLERGTIIRYTPDGTTRMVFANGLRNTIGYDWMLASGTMWGMDHGSDFRGDDLPPEELNHLKLGLNYGWPICYGERVVDAMTNARPARLALVPGQAQPSGQPMGRTDYCAATEPSTLTLPAHSAPMAMRFYRGGQFPPAYRDDAFIALHGSWNRGSPAGYKVVRLRFSGQGEPLGFEDFLTGFLNGAGTAVSGRPAGLAPAQDGALLVSDDANGVIYRVAYTGTR